MIAELEAKISSIKGRIVSKARKDSAVLKKWKRVEKTLSDFAQLAMDHDRTDVANSVSAFLAGTKRLVDAPPKQPKIQKAPDEAPERREALDLETADA